MNTTSLVAAVYLKSAGKLPTFVAGSTKWNKIVAIANDKIAVWQNELGANWNSLYDPAYSVGVVTATKTFALNDGIHTISDTVGDTVDITCLNGSTSSFETVEAARLKLFSSGKYCAQIGRNLVFNVAFTTSSSEFGGTIKAPVYLTAAQLVVGNDIVPVDDPQWLVLMSAAEYVRNDTVKQNQYGNLVNEANALMAAMKVVNEAQIEVVPRPWNPGGSSW